MKIARFSRTRPLLTVTEILSGSAGPDGQSVQSLGSNTVGWGSNVAIITSNGSNALVGPYVNFASGSNIIFTLEVGGFPQQSYPSNTLRIHVDPAITAMLSFAGAKAYATATQSVTASTETPVTFDSEEFDTHGFHSTSVTTSRFTIPPGLAGKYHLVAGGTVPNIGTTLDFKVNGTTYVRGAGAGSAAGNRNSVVGIADLAVGDYVELIAFAPSNTTIGHASARQEQMAMTIERIGA